MKATASTFTPWDFLAGALTLPFAHPRAVVLMGGPGSGKSWIASRVPCRAFKCWTIIDSDRERDRVSRADGEPEQAYHVRCRNAARTHMEDAIARRRDLYVEGLSCDWRKSALVLAALSETGYRIHGCAVNAPAKLAIARTRARARVDGRTVPESLCYRADQDLRSAWARLARYCVVLMEYDNARDGSAPVFGRVHFGRTPGVGAPVLLADVASEIDPRGRDPELSELRVRLAGALDLSLEKKRR